MLRSLDLFTGIGGITHALRGICEPVAYCENAQTRIDTLHSLFRRGKLPSAPIHPDVRNLKGSDVPEIDIIVGGWPCVGFSVTGRKNGFENEQSALFFEVDRLIEELKPKFVFQENVPMVSSGQGLDHVLQCLDRRGYDCRWVVLPGYIVGAPQQRFRWFCLAFRRDLDPKTSILTRNAMYERHAWTREPCERMTLTPPTRYHHQLAMLGNSVIPDCVRLAFMMLFTGQTTHINELWHANTLHMLKPSDMTHLHLKPLPPPQTSERYYGVMIDGMAYKLPKVDLGDKPDLGLCIDPAVYTHNGPIKAEEHKIVTTVSRRPMWCTPRAGCTTAGVIVTDRSRSDLYTFLRFERGTPDHLRAGRPQVSWTSWLMGFPVDWFEPNV